MKYQVILDADGRIGATVINNPDYTIGPDAIVLDFPGDFDFERQHDWRIVDDDLVYDPLPEPELPMDPNQQRMEEIEAALCELAEMMAGGGK